MDFARLINRVLRRFGYQIKRIRAHSPAHLQLVAEYAAFFQQHYLPDLPATPRRDELVTNLRGTSMSEILYIVTYLHRTRDVAGVVCEFGVADGATSAVMANEIQASDKHLWLFDSFEGLPRPTKEDVMLDDVSNLGAIENYAGMMSYGQDWVESRLRDIGFPAARTHIVAGYFDQTRQRPDLPDTVAFAYVDFDFYEPIRDVLAFLHPRLSPGAAVIVDDYGHFTAGGAQAVDEFLARHGAHYRVVHPPAWSAGYIILERQPASA